MMLKECLVLVISVHIFLNVSVVKASDDDDDLMDFDFDSVVNKPSNDSAATPKFDSAFDDFLDIIAVEPPGQGSHIAQKETRVKGKLVRAWKNPSMQRKFAEVLPILKVMTSEQKIALAALVSAQVGSKQGRELNLDQVRFNLIVHLFKSGETSQRNYETKQTIWGPVVRQSSRNVLSNIYSTQVCFHITASRHMDVLR